MLHPRGLGLHRQILQFSLYKIYPKAATVRVRVLSYKLYSNFASFSVTISSFFLLFYKRGAWQKENDGDIKVVVCGGHWC